MSSIPPFLSRPLDILFNGNQAANSQQVGANQLDEGPVADDAPSGEQLARSMPAGIERQLQTGSRDSLPPGLARQLAQGSAPPTGSPAPATSSPTSTPTPATAGPAASPAPLGDVVQMPRALPSSQPNAGPSNAAPMQGGPNGPPATGAGGQPASIASTPIGQTVAAAANTAAQSAQPFSAANAAAQNSQALPAAQTGPVAFGAAGPGNPAMFASAPSTVPAAITTASASSASNPLTNPASAQMLPAAARAEQSMVGRLTDMLRPAGELARNVLPAVAARDAAQTLSLIAPPPLSAPPSQAMPDSRAVGATGNESAAGPRLDSIMVPVYTGTGPARRRDRRDESESMGKRLRTAAEADSDEPEIARDVRPEKGTWFALQWMFWLVAIVAYGCLALALIAFLPEGIAAFDAINVNQVQPWAGTVVLVVGAAAAAAAWWMGRRLMRV